MCPRNLGQSTYHELIETVDRSISSLYRGGDLATMSSTLGEGTGSNSQDGESEVMDGDGCTLVSETLHRQIDRHVIRFTCGDFEPLAGIVINPPAEVNDIDRDMKIDQHLGEFGVKLSKKDMLTRYGRTEAADATDAAIRQIAQPGFGGLANERQPSRDARPSVDEQRPDLLAAFAADTSPIGEAVKELLNDPSPEAAKALLGRLPSLLPDDPAMAAVLAEAMAAEFGDKIVKNAITNPCPKCHHQRSKDNVCTHCEMTANHDRGKVALDKALKSKADVLNAMSRKSIGNIDFLWGNIGTAKKQFHDGEGISHILHNHPGDLQQMTGVVAFGDVYEYSDKYYIVKGRRFVSLRKRAGKNSYVITGFEANNPNYTREIRKGGTLIEKGE